MKSAKILEPKEITSILAEHFDIPESNIIKMQYSYIIVEQDLAAKENDNKDKK
mgnify:CR=1 FL=1